MDAASSTTVESNQAPGWSDLFLGVLTRPIETLRLLDQLSDTHAVTDLTTKAFNTVFLTATFLGLSRINLQDGLLSVFEFLSTLTNEMVFWVVSAAVMFLLSAVFADARPAKWKKALVLTGFSLAPVIFFVPMLCLKNTLGTGALLFATIPTWWTLFLLCMSYRIALGISGRKLLVIALILPPMLFLVYLFWGGLAFFMLVSELISTIRN